MSADHGCSCCAPSREESALAIAAAEPTPPLESRPQVSTKGMVRLSGGQFLMGTEDELGFPDDGEGPIRTIELSPFWVDETAVTNAQFARFVKETGFVTEAERFGWSYVFHLLLTEEARGAVMGPVPETPWWYAVRGAYWKQPAGPGTDFSSLQNHPVTHISWNDAQAFAAWSGKRLLTEAEWEYAARGGLTQKRYAWGDELLDRGRHRCNIWQGRFPTENLLDDGYLGTAPVRAFRANGFGLYNVAGNVWEWVADWWTNEHDLAATRDPRGPNEGVERVIRGGSYLCHDSYCNRYRVAARTKNTPDSSLGHTGFRLALDATSGDDG